MPRIHSEYDDDRPSPKGSNTVLWVILGIGGGILLLAVLVCGGIAYFAWSTVKTVKGVVEDMQSAQSAGETFMTKLQTGDVAGAYDTAGTAFRGRQTKDQFEKFVAGHPGLSPHTNRTSNAFHMNTTNGVTNYTARFSLTGPTGTLNCNVILAVENGAWVVDSITVP
jgi:hypothetical protein